MAFIIKYNTSILKPHFNNIIKEQKEEKTKYRFLKKVVSFTISKKINWSLSPRIYNKYTVILEQIHRIRKIHKIKQNLYYNWLY